MCIGWPDDSMGDGPTPGHSGTLTSRGGGGTRPGFGYQLQNGLPELWL